MMFSTDQVLFWNSRLHTGRTRIEGAADTWLRDVSAPCPARMYLMAAAFLLCAGGTLPALAEQVLDLYVDAVTKQVYAEPGPDRIRLGRFVRAEEPSPEPGRDGAVSAGAVAAHRETADDVRDTSTGQSEKRTGELTPGPVSEDKLGERIAQEIDRRLPIDVSHTDKGFTFDSRDGRWRTQLAWRAQLRYTNPFVGDPRQIANFDNDDKSTFEARRLRMKIGGHGYQPWLKYYFEVDLQPSRDVDDASESSSARVIDWRIDIAKWPWAQLRVGQWKIDFNRERVDSSGRQQFVERSIVNRVFTIDRQVGVQLRGHLFADTPADMRYYAGVFTGEGRGVENSDQNMMWMGRLQWNFLGRDLDWKQTDVEYTELPTGSIAFAAATNEGRCTRWSSGGCGNLDGFRTPSAATDAQYAIDQMVQEFAFKWRGFSVQQEFHWKTIDDQLSGMETDMTGAYAQAGYFFHHWIPVVPAPLELAFRYAFVSEPNRFELTRDNLREEFTVGANWFFAGHNNKLTLDYSHLSLEDAFLLRDVSDDRVRFQWDVSF